MLRGRALSIRHRRPPDITTRRRENSGRTTVHEAQKKPLGTAGATVRLHFTTQLARINFRTVAAQQMRGATTVYAAGTNACRAIFCIIAILELLYAILYVRH